MAVSTSSSVISTSSLAYNVSNSRARVAASRASVVVLDCPAFTPSSVASSSAFALVLLVGLYGQKWHLGAEAGRGLGDTVRDFERVLRRPGRPRFFPLPHPSWRNSAWLKRNPWFETELLPVLRREVRALLEVE